MERRYSEMIQYATFEERFEYLKLVGRVGAETFGFDRVLNQRFYKSREWRDIRSYVIARDEGCDLAMPGYEIHHGLLVHHMNPIGLQDLRDYNPDILDPENLICTTQETHNAIHYGNPLERPRQFSERRPGDTTLW